MINNRLYNKTTCILMLGNLQSPSPDICIFLIFFFSGNIKPETSWTDCVCVCVCVWIIKAFHRGFVPTEFVIMVTWVCLYRSPSNLCQWSIMADIPIVFKGNGVFLFLVNMLPFIKLFIINDKLSCYVRKLANLILLFMVHRLSIYVITWSES